VFGWASSCDSRRLRSASGNLTALSILAPASDAHASPVFCASLARPGSSPFTFAEALDISAGGTVSYVARLSWCK
jgi:hypothetical protein